MKCRSVVGIWSETPPVHRITATTVFTRPPTLYTGAADGSIVWWSLFDDEPNKVIKPIAMLCGHAAPIADLGICYPLLASTDGNINLLGDLAINFAAGSNGALVSACTDGVLCVWSRGSGHCRRRRKLPPWVGSPTIVQTLPTNPRYICIACGFIDASHVHDYDYSDPGVEGPVEWELVPRKPPKCAVVIVDSYTLTIVQTVFHGSLSIGPLKFMDLIRPFADKSQQLVLMVDSSGKIQLLPLLKDSNIDIEAVNRLQDNLSRLEMSTCESGACDRDILVSMVTSGQIFGLVFRTHSVFFLLASGVLMGRISFQNSVLLGDGSSPSHVIGGMFLSSDTTNTMHFSEAHDPIALKFAAWNNRGTLVVYGVSYIDDVFKSGVICEIPAVCYPVHVRISFHFVWLDNYFLRVQSNCYHEQEPFSWKPLITIWSISEQLSDHENLGCGSKLLGEGDFVANWIGRPSFTEKSEFSKHALGVVPAVQGSVLTSLNNCVPNMESNSLSGNDVKCISAQIGRIVSSSMVISQSTHIPYAIVYGYSSGEIELVTLEGSLSASGLNGSRKCFLGHTGAVLCLATQKKVGNCSAQNFNQVLLSGSMDCTLRVWNLETGSLIMVMHHHVAPLRQIVLPPFQTQHPWNNCFLSIGEDSCVALVSLETLRVERMFPGHPSYPSRVVWDSVRGYLACLSQNPSVSSGTTDVLHIWDMKAGARERVLRGTASHSMFDNFCRGINTSNISSIYNHNTSASCLCLPFLDEGETLHFPEKRKSGYISSRAGNLTTPSKYKSNADQGNSQNLNIGVTFSREMLPIRCSCPFSGISILRFDLASLMSADVMEDGGKLQNVTSEHAMCIRGSNQEIIKEGFCVGGNLDNAINGHSQENALAVSLLRFSLSLLHLWDVDVELDHFLIGEMMLEKPEKFNVAPGVQGDRGAVTLAFPGFSCALELWKSSAEFSAMRSLTIVSLGQHMVKLSPSTSVASSALSAFYTRNFAEKHPHIKPPSLQLLASFWQDEDEHVRMAARTLFHCAASRAIPPPLSMERTLDVSCFVQARGSKMEHNLEEEETNCFDTGGQLKVNRSSQYVDKEILKWLESYELQDWISCVGGTSQDAMASHIIVAAALAIWYPTLVKPSLAMLAVHPLMKLVMAMNEKYSSAAAELLAEGMDNIWKACIGHEIHRLIGDIFFQIECVSDASANNALAGPVVPPKMRETLVSILLPSLALADIPGFLTEIEGLIWSTASDSPAHLVSLTTLIRIMHGSPRVLAQHLQKVVNFVLQTMDPSNPVMRKTCLQSSTTALKELTRVYPMVALNDTSTRLAVGDAIAEMNRASIHVFDMQSVSKVKILDASGFPGLPNLLSGTSETVATAISALSFSPDGEGLVAFSEHGLIIRWWSLGSVWWEKISRNLVPVQCTKLIIVPPWEGFSPNSSRASIMASITGCGQQSSFQENSRDQSDMDSLNILIHNLDLSYRLEWAGKHQILLTRQGHELGTFQLQA